MDENVRHLLWSCAFAQTVWAILKPWLGDLYREPSEKDVLYGNLDINKCKRWERWWMVINCVKEGIWRSRNLVVFKKFYVTPDSVVKGILSMVKDYVWRDRKKYNDTEVKDYWEIRQDFITQNLMD